MGLFTKQKAYSEKDMNLAIQNLYQLTGLDLPILKTDGYNYISEVWKKIGVVYECVNIIYKKAIKCPLVVYKVKDEKSRKKYDALENKSTPQALILKSKAFEEVQIPELETLLANPNPQQDYNNFIGILIISYLTQGNSFVYSFNSAITEKPLELWAFPELKINGGGIYNPIKSYTQFFNTDKSKEYPADTIYHMKTPNPEFDMMGTQLYGVSPLRAHLESLRTIDEATKQSSKQMKNGGVLGLIMPKNSEDKLVQEQRAGFMDALKAAMRGNRDFGRFMTSSIEVDYKQIGLPSSDLDLLAIKSATEESIFRLFGIPLSRYNQNASTRDNMKLSNAQLITDAVAPVCDILSQMLTNFVGKKFGNVKIELDYTQLEEMSANMKEVTEYLVKQIEYSMITPDEARYALKYGETNEAYMKQYYYKGRLLKQIFKNGEQSGNNNGSK